jgi:hypothetical protein
VSDTDHAGALIQRGGPSLDQVVLVHLGGSLPTPPGQGVRVRFRGGLVPYGDQETAAFHKAVARAGGQGRSVNGRGFVGGRADHGVFCPTPRKGIFQRCYDGMSSGVTETGQCWNAHV